MKISHIMGHTAVNHINRRQQEAYAARTGIVVDIQNIGKNTELIAVKEKKSFQEIKPGVWLKKEVIKFSDGNFSNVYDVSWNPKSTDIFPAIHSSNEPYTLYDQIKADPTAIAVINGSFFFLADFANQTPQDLPYDFCVRNAVIIGLPSSDQPILYIKNSKLHVKEPFAKGRMLIGKHVVSWVGVKSKKNNNTKHTAVLYNSKCSEIIRVRDKKTNVQIGILDTNAITTPSSADVFDIVVGVNPKGQLEITHINIGGGTHFYNGAFVLQIKGNPALYRIGNRVKPLTLDGLSLQNISAGITIGRKVSSVDMIPPERRKIRDARSLISKDIQGFIHFTVFDGSKYIPGFNGASPKDISRYFSPKKYQWAYFLDGGGSSRIILKEEDSLSFFANEFAFTKLKNGKHLWDWQKARKIASSISLHML